MRIIGLTALAGLALALTACGGKEEQATTGDQVADQLDQAAAQSSPAAREVIEERADQARGMGSMAPPGEPGSYAQRTMEEAGKADSSQKPATQP